MSLEGRSWRVKAWDFSLKRFSRHNVEKELQCKHDKFFPASYSSSPAAFRMDFDATIERLNALKLQERSPTPSQQHPQPNVAASTSETAQLQHELRRLQEEQERQAQLWQQQMRELQTRLEASEHQNQLLKVALGEMDTYRHQSETQQLVIQELQTQVKQLRLTNYRLQYVVQQHEPRGQGSFLPPPPPDIF